MAIYRMVGNKEDLEAVPETSFSEEDLLERQDLQRILRDKPDILEAGLFVVTEEFSDWQGSGPSIDLLGIDTTGRLVVVKLKRSDTDEHMDLQAIRYAAMVSTITLRQAIDAHQTYLTNRGIDEDAEERVNGHLKNPESKGFSTDQPRIILVSEGFSPELTTCVLWLNRNGLDVTCIRMQPYRNGTELLVETSQVIPLPEEDDYLVRIQERENEVHKQRPVSSKPIPGSEVFEQYIQDARPEFQQELNRLYKWAVHLEQEGLTELETNIGITRTTLGAVVPGDKVRLITVCNDSKGAGIWLSRRPLERLAPQQLLLIDELKASGSDTLREPSDELLDAFRAAYREANGLPNNGDGDGE